MIRLSTVLQAHVLGAGLVAPYPSTRVPAAVRSAWPERRLGNTDTVHLSDEYISFMFQKVG